MWLDLDDKTITKTFCFVENFFIIKRTEKLLIAINSCLFSATNYDQTKAGHKTKLRFKSQTYICCFKLCNQCASGKMLKLIFFV